METETTDRQFFLETEMQTQTFIDKADIDNNNWFYSKAWGPSMGPIAFFEMRPALDH